MARLLGVGSGRKITKPSGGLASVARPQRGPPLHSVFQKIALRDMSQRLPTPCKMSTPRGTPDILTYGDPRGGWTQSVNAKITNKIGLQTIYSSRVTSSNSVCSSIMVSLRSRAARTPGGISALLHQSSGWTLEVMYTLFQLAQTIPPLTGT